MVRFLLLEYYQELSQNMKWEGQKDPLLHGPHVVRMQMTSNRTLPQFSHMYWGTRVFGVL